MAAGHHFGSSATGNSTKRSADPENPILEPSIQFINWWSGGYLGRHLEFLKTLIVYQSPLGGL